MSLSSAPGEASGMGRERAQGLGMLDYGTVVAPCRVRNGLHLGLFIVGFFFFFFWLGVGRWGAKRYPYGLIGIVRDWKSSSSFGQMSGRCRCVCASV